MKKGISRRARVLSRILEFVSANDFADFGDYVVFGEEAYNRHLLGPKAEAGQAEDDEDILRTMEHRQALFSGSRLAGERTSLHRDLDFDARAADLADLFKRLSPQIKKTMLDALDRPAYSQPATDMSSALTGDDIECLDAKYSEEVLHKLECIVSRASELSKVETDVPANRRVRIYFDKAHECYLYGFDAACAVMCRAILEQGLSEAVDPNRRLKYSKEREEELLRIYEGQIPVARAKDIVKSHIINMVYKAWKEGLLDDPLPEQAEKITLAGNDAVHDVEEFERQYSGKAIRDILDWTRAILLKLYENSLVSSPRPPS
jgi:hypothetical protein